MAKLAKTPQENKHLEYNRDHFTFSSSGRAFSKAWMQKKALANRQYRRKSDELLALAKPMMPAKLVEVVAGDFTAAHLTKPVLRKRQ